MMTMTVAQFPAANAALELVTREVPEPGAGQVLLRVRACGICHSDLFVQGGAFPGLKLPRVPGHEAAPLLCAGLTTFNALRNSPARPGDLVAVQGLGGLGHLAVQFAHRMGFRTVAIARGDDKRPLATQLGADQYVDSAKGSAGQALAAMGGARVIVATAPNAAAIEDVMGGLGVAGQLLLIGAVAEPLAVSALPLLSLRQSIRGWPGGHAKDSEDTLRFAAATGIRPMVETFPLARANEAFARMVSGKARFRVVLTMG